jgi:hypothetical protein
MVTLYYGASAGNAKLMLEQGLTPQRRGGWLYAATLDVAMWYARVWAVAMNATGREPEPRAVTLALSLDDDTPAEPDADEEDQWRLLIPHVPAGRIRVVRSQLLDRAANPGLWIAHLVSSRNITHHHPGRVDPYKDDTPYPALYGEVVKILNAIGQDEGNLYARFTRNTRRRPR